MYLKKTGKICDEKNKVRRKQKNLRMFCEIVSEGKKNGNTVLSNVLSYPIILRSSFP